MYCIANYQTVKNELDSADKSEQNTVLKNCKTEGSMGLCWLQRYLFETFEINI